METGFKGKLHLLLRAFLVYFLALLLISWLLVLTSWFLKTYFHFDYGKIIGRNWEQISGGSRLKVFFFICLYAPLVEELLFRGWLRFQKRFIALFFVVLIWVCTGGPGLLKANIVSTYAVSWHVIGAFLGGFLLVYYLLPAKFFQKMAKVRFGYWYYLSSIVFGLIHLTNVLPANPLILFLCIPLIFPQTIMGFLFGYVRLKNGLIWGMLFHFLNNLLVFLLM